MKKHAEKLSISLQNTMILFIKEYQLTHSYKTTSEVFQDAIKLLRKKELEKEYAQANLESDGSLDNLSADGLDDETW